MRFLLLLTLFAHLAPQASNLINRNVQIVFVQQPGETFTIEEQQQVVASVKSAIVFWHDLSPVTTTLAIASTELLTTTFDVYDNPQWFDAIFDRPHDITIVIIDNSSNGKPLPAGNFAGANTHYDIIVVTTKGNGLPNEQAALLTHELGHVLYDLPDLYTHGCSGTDIMCNPITAYGAYTIGCVSLEYLGYPCKRIYLPAIAV
jgi:hypothetical protein